ncbi:hypothetical protein ALC53_12498 [Atta colombica]|uniref:DNA-directed DNA polymerase n=1 Tax=Atta colombica TaxID=520822 RepID=A0A151HZM0_9HYME|nr:hypothetical protein ALC53_12498 [Atta colombica]
MQRYDSIKINTHRFARVVHVIEPTLSLEEFQERDNGWALSRILNIFPSTSSSMRRGSYRFADRKRSKYVNFLYNAKYFVLIENLHHNVFSVGYYMYSSLDTEELRNLAHSVQSIISANVLMDFTQDDWQKFNSATHCHVCEKSFAPDDTRVRDHCHLSGRYRGPAHKLDSHCILVVFHNLSGYDFVIKEIATSTKDAFIFCVEKLEELCLSPHESFYSSLTDDTIFENAYALALNISVTVASRVMARVLLHFIELHYVLKHTGVIIYYDVKNLYSWKMCQPLPYVDFRWVDDVQNFDFTTILSDAREIISGKRDDMLLATLCDKQRYVIHYHNLQQCIRKFIQIYNMNAVFGKTLENIRDRVDIKLLTQWEGRYSAKAMIANNAPSQQNWSSMPLANKKVPGLMKDENNDAILKKAKGIKNNVVAKSITFEDYTRCLNGAIEMRRQLWIRSTLHDVYRIRNKNL